MSNPARGIDFFPVEKRVKRVPTQDEIDLVISTASADTKDYLWAVRETLARVSEINRLAWKDVLSTPGPLCSTRERSGAVT